MILPVILCGGSGTRLWPLSRRMYPKQFHCLHGEGTLLQQTTRRAEEVADHGSLIVVTNETQRFLVLDQLKEVPDLHVLIEPVARNTAPAIALAALYAKAAMGNLEEQVNLLVMPSDHLITDLPAFKRMVTVADGLAGRGKLVTFGVRPSCAETGYGYIQRGAAIQSMEDAFDVDRFIEKPDSATAQRLWNSGNHLWNSGIFMFGADVYLDQLRMLSQDVYDASVAAYSGKQFDKNFVVVPSDEFASCPNISVDYAVMERTTEAVVVSFAGSWSDIGSWEGLWKTVQSAEEKTGRDNFTVGEVYARDVTGSYIHSGSRLVAVLGVEDMIIVETADAVLVARKGHDQKIRDLVEEMHRDNRMEVEHHTQVYRPWGSYESLEQDHHFQVKRLIIKPGASISLQLHHRRAEHWVVVQGEAVVTKGEETFTLGPNESTFIPRETVHKLENHSDMDLEIIEVQTGEYFGEDDIERFEDQYGRT